MDGAGTLRILVQIVSPLIAPGIGASAVITFLFTWNDLLIALTLDFQRKGSDATGWPHQILRVPSELTGARCRLRSLDGHPDPHFRLVRAGVARERAGRRSSSRLTRGTLGSRTGPWSLNTTNAVAEFGATAEVGLDWKARGDRMKIVAVIPWLVNVERTYWGEPICCSSAVSAGSCASARISSGYTRICRLELGRSKRVSMRTGKSAIGNRASSPSKAITAPLRPAESSSIHGRPHAPAHDT